MQDLYAVFAYKGHHPSFAICPSPFVVVGSRDIPNGYCHPPLTLPLDEAELLAEHLSKTTGMDWKLEVAPTPCPACGRKISPADYDFVYPENRERTQWRAGCDIHNFGCGHEVKGPTRESVLEAWKQPTAPRKRGRHAT